MREYDLVIDDELGDWNRLSTERFADAYVLEDAVYEELLENVSGGACCPSADS